MADHEVVQHLDVEQLARGHDLARDRHVLGRGRAVATEYGSSVTTIPRIVQWRKAVARFDSLYLVHPRCRSLGQRMCPQTATYPWPNRMAGSDSASWHDQAPQMLAGRRISGLVTRCIQALPTGVAVGGDRTGLTANHGLALSARRALNASFLEVNGSSRRASSSPASAAQRACGGA